MFECTSNLPTDPVNKNVAHDWHTATGPLTIPMTNDYLFRALLQRNNRILKGLVCSLLHLSPQEVTSAVINNPIVLGKPSVKKPSFWMSRSL